MHGDADPTDSGKTWTFKIRPGIKFTDGTPLTADDVVASWDEIIHPPHGILSPRQSHHMMVDRVEAPDPSTVVFHLKFATNAFLPALADPYSWIYEKKIIDKDPKWYMQHIMGTGPFKFVSYQAGQAIKGVKNPDYFRKGLPYLDGFTGIYAPKQAVQIDAIRSDRGGDRVPRLPAVGGQPAEAGARRQDHSAAEATGIAAASSSSTKSKSRSTMSECAAR